MDRKLYFQIFRIELHRVVDHTVDQELTFGQHVLDHSLSKEVSINRDLIEDQTCKCPLTGIYIFNGLLNEISDVVQLLDEEMSQE